jgi:hypothetical protein
VNAIRATPPDPMLLMSPDGRFAIVTRERLMAQAAPVASVEDTPAAMLRVWRTLPWRSEEETRTELAALGLDASAIEVQFAAARRKLAVMTSQPTVMERITKVGYRNAEGQEVVRPTDRRAGGQRIFVMRCTVCGHEYRSYGCDADIRRCPGCQDGLPGLPIDVGV